MDNKIHEVSVYPNLATYNGRLNTVKQKKLVMSVQEMADILGISVTNAYNLANSEGFPSLRPSERRIVVSVDGFYAWLKHQVTDKLGYDYEKEA